MSALLRHISAALQLMRWKLAITAIADGQCALLLASLQGDGVWEPRGAIAVGLMSLGLYAGGMTLNDLVDSKRDAFLHPGKPIPSGRISVPAAHAWCIGWFALGLIGGIATVMGSGHILTSTFFLIWTLLLILFYNFVGKFLGSSGIISLGLVRFFHAAIAQPLLWVIGHPLMLLNHVGVLSAVCYILEDKRPRLSRAHRWFVGIALVLLNLFIFSGLALVTLSRHSASEVLRRLGLEWGLLYPLGAGLIFWTVAIVMLRRLPQQPTAEGDEKVSAGAQRQWLLRRQRAGRRLMFAGLLFLIIYDAAFVLGFL